MLYNSYIENERGMKMSSYEYQKNRYSRIVVRVYKDQKPIIERYVAENGTDINALINELLAYAVPNFKPIKGNKPKYD